MLDLPTPASHALDPDSGLWVPVRRGLCSVSSAVAGAAAMQGRRRTLAGGAWLPSDITGVAEWWRADLGVTDAGAGAVSAWQGQIAGETLSQGTAAARPTLTTRDSQSVLSFDGGDWLQGAFGTITLSQPFTVVVVAEFTADLPNRHFWDGDDATNRAYAIRNNAATEQLASFAGATITGGTVDLAEIAVVSVLNGASSSHYLNNLTTPSASGNAGTAVIDGLTVWANYLGSGTSPGFVWEVILVNAAISAGDLALLGAYLDARYAGLSLTY